MENFFCNSSLLKKQLKRKKTSSASFHAQTSFSIPQPDLDLQQSNTNSISQSTNLLPQHSRTHHNPHVSDISASQSTSVSNSVNLNVTPAGSAANPLTTVPPRQCPSKACTLRVLRDMFISLGFLKISLRMMLWLMSKTKYKVLIFRWINLILTTPGKSHHLKYRAQKVFLLIFVNHTFGLNISLWLSTKEMQIEREIGIR